jgi:hypothetical protein
MGICVFVYPNSLVAEPEGSKPLIPKSAVVQGLEPITSFSDPHKPFP